jgi:hypothetical protein
VALLGALAAPSLASASTYCVNEPACVKAGGIEEGTDGTALQSAFTAAAGHANSGGPDRVLIGAGRYTRTGGLEYSGDEVIVKGAGEGVTTITAPTTPGTVFNLQTSPGTVSDLSVEIPLGTTYIGINSNAARLERISIFTSSTGHATGLKTDGGSFSHGTIEVPNGTGVESDGTELLDSSIQALEGVVVQTAAADAIRRCRISGRDPIELFEAGSDTVEDTLIDMHDEDGVGVRVSDEKASTATLRQLTIINGGVSATGINVRGFGAKANATLADSVISGVEHAVVEQGFKAGGNASLTTSYSSFSTTGDRVEGVEGGSTPAAPKVETPVAGAPSFITPSIGEAAFATGNWRPRIDSALIDVGTPGALTAGESVTDLDGNARVVNGRRDVGAYEFQRRAPLVSASATDVTAPVGQAVSFGGLAEVPEAAAGDTVTYRWTFDDGASVAAGATAQHAFLTVGIHTATLTATDLLGLSASAKVTVDVTAALEIVGKQLPPLPLISDLRFVPATFLAARKGASISGKHTGSRVVFALAEAARVSFTVRRILPGVHHGHSCLAPRKGLRGKACSRTVKVRGGFTRADAEGLNSFTFSGRIGGRSLAPGRYELIAFAVAASRQESATAGFRVIG